jgi:hypothetical protein
MKIELGDECSALHGHSLRNVDYFTTTSNFLQAKWKTKTNSENVNRKVAEIPATQHYLRSVSLCSEHCRRISQFDQL